MNPGPCNVFDFWFNIENYIKAYWFFQIFMLYFVEGTFLIKKFSHI